MKIEDIAQETSVPEIEQTDPKTITSADNLRNVPLEFFINAKLNRIKLTLVQFYSLIYSKIHFPLFCKLISCMRKMEKRWK